MDHLDNRLHSLDIPLPEMFDGLSIFLVGGGVRDENPHDIDLMVEGATRANLLNRGFKLVHNEADRFPVFFDEAGRDVALARTETSTGDGPREFKPVEHPDVTVEEDLGRRDFTVNSMAVSLTDNGRFNRGDLIDPFDGRKDLRNGVLRMVSDQSFAEDPLRILRLARFAARLDFSVESATMQSARESAEGLHNLPNDRWGKEFVKAMKQADRPSRFFRVLDDAEALDIVLPELRALQDVPAGPSEFHKEGSAFEHTLMVMDEMAELRPGEPRAMVAALGHDLGKALTSEDKHPSHHRHEELASEVIPDIRDRLELPAEFAGGARESSGGVMGSAARWHMHMHRLDELREITLLRMLDRLRDDYEVHNPGDRVRMKHVTPDELIDLAEADSKGRIPPKAFDRENAQARFDEVLAVIEDVDGASIAQNFEPQGGAHWKTLIEQERIKALQNPEQ